MNSIKKYQYNSESLKIELYIPNKEETIIKINNEKIYLYVNKRPIQWKNGKKIIKEFIKNYRKI
jgi:DNA mismatch repair ATPase MutL